MSEEEREDSIAGTWIMLAGDILTLPPDALERVCAAAGMTEHIDLVREISAVVARRGRGERVQIRTQEFPEECPEYVQIQIGPSRDNDLTA